LEVECLESHARSIYPCSDRAHDELSKERRRKKREKE